MDQFVHGLCVLVLFEVHQDARYAIIKLIPNAAIQFSLVKKGIHGIKYSAFVKVQFAIQSAELSQAFPIQWDCFVIEV